jgi:5-formyltetrahydrofolate cyclo-ligase
MLQGPRRGESTKDRKQELRAAALKKRRSLSGAQLMELSARVGANLLALDEYRRARLIVSYCAMKDEVQTRPIIERAIADGKRVAVVATNPSSLTLSYCEIASFADDLAPGAFGILEPKPGCGKSISLSQADMMLVPLVAWDERGHRLGYGAGYFDRALQRSRVTKVGLALESQRLPQIPESRFDVPLDVIVTEERVVRPRGRSARKHSKA